MLALILGARNMASDRQYTDFDFDFGTGRKSVHSITATVPREELDTYLAQMRDFAKANDFKIRIKRLKPGFDVFFVDLWRSNVMVTGNNVSDTSNFYGHIYIDPEKGGSAEMAAALVKSMKEFISQVPGVTIKQRR